MPFSSNSEWVSMYAYKKNMSIIGRHYLLTYPFAYVGHPSEGYSWEPMQQDTYKWIS